MSDRESVQLTRTEQIEAHRHAAADCYRISERYRDAGNPKRAEWWQRMWRKKLEDADNVAKRRPRA